MRRHLRLIPLSFMLFLAGCGVDARIKRAASLANTKMQVEAAEFYAAPDEAARARIAERHFESMPKFTQIIDDYMQGREPAKVQAVPIEPAPVRETASETRPEIPEP